MWAGGPGPRKGVGGRYGRPYQIIFFSSSILPGWLCDSCRGEDMSKKIWNCLSSNLGILKLSVLINQKIFKTVYRNFLKTTLIGHDGHSQQMWASLVNPSSTIKETIVLNGKYIFLSLKIACFIFSLTEYAEGLQHIFSASVRSKTVYHKSKFLKLSTGL